MKKKIFLVALLLLSLSLLISCSGAIDKVSNFKLDADTLTLSWDRVLGAKSYTISISGEEFEKTTKQNSLSLEYLDPGTYEIKVKANSDGTEKKNSDWATYTFIREQESGMRYKLINNKTEYQLTGLGTASGDIIMDDTYRGKPITSIAEKAFSGNTKITSFVVGNNVKEIGNSAFARCAELTSITIPDSVTKIGKSCFQSCKKLTDITFPASTKNIEEYTFSWCSSLKTISFSDNIESVGLYAFSNCDALEAVVFGDSLKLIDEYAFSDCKALTKAHLGNSLESLKTYAFYNCVSLADLKLGESLKEIGEYALGNCDAITSLTLPDSCERIDNFAFRYSDNLEEINLGANLSYIGHGAFNSTKLYNDAEVEFIVDGWYIYCKDKEIKNVTLPEGVYGIADSAFANCTEITAVQFPNIKYISANAFYKCTKLRYAYFPGDTLLSVGMYAFKGCEKLSQVQLGNSLQSIGDFAFSGCSDLQDAKISRLPDTLTHIGKDAFKGTKATVEKRVMYISNWAVGFDLGASAGMVTAPEQVIIRKGTRGIANYAFNEVPIIQTNSDIYGIDIADSVEYIGRGAFYKAAANDYGFAVFVKLPANLKYIGDYAFYGDYCAIFSKNPNRILEIPEGTIYIGRSAFYNCQSIFSLSVPGTVEEIAPYAFYGCINIGASLPGENENDPDIVGSITLSEGLKTISDRAFYGCSGIAKLTIPDSVTHIGLRAFYKCTGIKELTIGAGITEIADYAFYNCSLLEKLTIADSVTSIGKYAFRGCNALKEIKFSNSLKTIGDFAFFGAEYITELVIPDGVTYIGKHAFRGMSRARSIIIPASVTEIASHAFFGAENSVIYILEGASTENWDERWNSSFATVITECKLSADKTYIESFVKNESNPDNMPIDSGIKEPVREGYKFVGFSTTAGSDTAEYTTENLSEAPNNSTLYTVWDLA